MNIHRGCVKLIPIETKGVGKPLLNFGKEEQMNLDILKEWIEPVLNEKDCVLYDIEWLTNQNPPILQISVEKQDGTMDLDTCAMCSDVIGTLLDNKDWYTKEYMLEVCSPGAERELKTDQQLRDAIGKYVYVKLIDPKQGLDQVLGDLKEVNDDSIIVAYKEKTRNKTIEIDRNNINVIMTAVKL